MTAGDNQHRALRVTDDVFCDAPDERVLQSGATVSRSDDEINLGVARCGADFVHRETGEKFGLNRHVAQKIHLLERVHFLPGCFFHRFGQPGETNAGAINEHVICIRIHRVKEAQRGVKILCQKRGVFRSGERTLREIRRNQNGADGECFASSLSIFVFVFARQAQGTVRCGRLVPPCSRAEDASVRCVLASKERLSRHQSRGPTRTISS